MSDHFPPARPPSASANSPFALPERPSLLARPTSSTALDLVLTSNTSTLGLSAASPDLAPPPATSPAQDQASPTALAGTVENVDNIDQLKPTHQSTYRPRPVDPRQRPTSPVPTFIARGSSVSRQSSIDPSASVQGSSTIGKFATLSAASTPAALTPPSGSPAPGPLVGTLRPTSPIEPTFPSSSALPPTSTSAVSSKTSQPPLIKSIKLKIKTLPAKQPSPLVRSPKPKPKARASSALPMRDQMYAIGSDDDGEIIECEPDPDDVKPVIPTPAQPSREDKGKGREAENEEERRKRERGKRKREEKEEERTKKERREEPRKENEFERREETGKAKALAEQMEMEREAEKGQAIVRQKALRKSQEQAAKRREETKKEKACSKSASNQADKSSSSSSSMPPPPKPSATPMITTKPPPVSFSKKPDEPLFARATPVPTPTIDLTTDSSLPATPQHSSTKPASLVNKPSSSTSSSKPPSQKRVILDQDTISEEDEDEGEDELTGEEDDLPVRPRTYEELQDVLSPKAKPATEANDKMDVDGPFAGPDRSDRAESDVPIPPSNMNSTVPVEVQKENDMPALDATEVVQMYKGNERVFKKGPDGFFSCTICRGYSKPHPVMFKVHVVRCAQDYADYPSDESSDPDSSSDSDPSARRKKAAKEDKVKTKTKTKLTTKAVVKRPVDSSDGEHLHSSLSESESDTDTDSQSEPAPKKVKMERGEGVPKKKTVASKESVRKERRELKKKSLKRREVKTEKKKPKVRRENRAIPTSARPGGSKFKSKAIVGDSDDEFDEIKPLGGLKRQQPFAREAGLITDQVNLIVDSDDTESEEDDGTIDVLVKSERVGVRPGPDGKYTCPACASYHCKNPGYLKDHIRTCAQARVAPRNEAIPLTSSLHSFNPPRSPSSVSQPPQLTRTRQIKNRNSPVPLPAIRRKEPPTGPSFLRQAASSALLQSTSTQPVGTRYDGDWLPPMPPQMNNSFANDDFPDSSFDASRYSPPPVPSHAGPSHFCSDAYDVTAVHLASSVHRPRSPTPPPFDDDVRTNHPPPGILAHTLNNLLHPIMPHPPPMQLMQDIPLLLELMRRWQAVIIADARKGFENGVSSREEGIALRETWSQMMTTSSIETQYSTWQDNAMRLWHLQHHLTTRLDRPSEFRDLVKAYFDLDNRPTVWACGKAEQKHIKQLGTACKNLLWTVQDAWKHYKGPPNQSSRWLRDANLSITSPIHLDLNHMSWAEISREMRDWADGILASYQELVKVEQKSRATAEREAREQRLALAEHAREEMIHRSKLEAARAQMASCGTTV